MPCTAKSDNDLPRYGKRWDYTPNIPATMRPESSVPEPAVGEDPSSLQLDNLQDAFVVGQTVTIAGISVSTGSDTLATVVQVLDSDLPADEQNLIKAVVESVGFMLLISFPLNILRKNCTGGKPRNYHKIVLP